MELLASAIKVNCFLSTSKIRLNTRKPNTKDCEFATRVGFLPKEHIFRTKYTQLLIVADAAYCIGQVRGDM